MPTDFKKKKRYGQNFLTSPVIPSRIAEGSGCSGKGVIEIGPGLGILTQQLLNVADKVVAIEIDEELIPILTEKFSGESRFSLINADVLDCDLTSIISENFGDKDVCVCANLPYYVTTPILMKLLEGGYGFKTVTVMVQREVADRIICKKGDSENSALTVVCSYYASVKKLFNVSAGSFSPPPKVNSAVIRFDLYEEPKAVSDREMLFKVIKAAFAQRRKTLTNSLYSVFSAEITKSDLEEVMLSASLDANARAEDLDIDDYIKLTDALHAALQNK